MKIKDFLLPVFLAFAAISAMAGRSRIRRLQTIWRQTSAVVTALALVCASSWAGMPPLEDYISFTEAYGKGKMGVTRIRGARGVPYLALSSADIAEYDEEKLPGIVVSRAKTVCRANQKGSLLNYDVKVVKKNSRVALAYKGRDGRFYDKFFKAKTDVKQLSILFDVGLFALTGGLAALGTIGKGISRGKLALGAGLLVAADIALSYGIHAITARRLSGLKLEGMWKRYYLTFRAVDCLNEKQEDIPPEEKLEFKTRYSCLWGVRYGRLCWELPINPLICVMDKGSRYKSVCRDIATEAARAGAD